MRGLCHARQLLCLSSVSSTPGQQQCLGVSPFVSQFVHRSVHALVSPVHSHWPGRACEPRETQCHALVRPVSACILKARNTYWSGQTAPVVRSPMSRIGQACECLRSSPVRSHWPGRACEPRESQEHVLVRPGSACRLKPSVTHWSGDAMPASNHLRQARQPQVHAWFSVVLHSLRPAA